MESNYEQQPELVIINVESEPDPKSRIFCCGSLTNQQQLDYQISLHDRDFVIPNVGANICRKCESSYLAPKVGNAISKRIFETTNSKEVQLQKLLND